MQILTKLGPPIGFSILTTSCINRWNTPGAFVKPKGMIRNSNQPCWITNAVFSLDMSLILTCQYPEARSNVEKYFCFLVDLACHQSLGEGNDLAW